MHDHDRHHDHDRPPADFGMAFAVGIALNTAFVLIEAGYGVASNSVALIADAGHNLSDVLGLVAAWIAVNLSKRPPSKRYTYGLRGSSILAAMFNAVFLLIAVGAIGWESLLRLFQPQPVASTTVMIVAAIGILINGITAVMFASGRKQDLNIRGAYLHMAADAAVSAGVLMAALAILFTGWLWLDPVVSLVIVAVIFWGAWGLLRDSVAMSLSAAPRHIEPTAVLVFLKKQNGVSDVHDLHIWPIGTTEIALTAHLVMPAGHPGDEFVLEVSEGLRRHYGIGHVTLQVERSGASCPLAPEHVV